jgi:VWFA-related protein
MNWFLRIFVFVALATTCIADSIVYMRVHKPLIEEQLKLAPATEPDRIKTLRSLFQKGGCPQVIEQPVPNQDFPNLICILPGDEEGTIVVGASSDYVSQDTNPPGGWSSLAMLPLLTESLSLVPHRFTLMFIAFTGHENGMSGASWYVRQLTDNQRKTIRAMIVLDDLGKTPPVFVQAQSDKTLATWLQVASQSLRIAAPAQVDASIANLADQPFQQEHIPAISMQSAAPAMLPALQRSGAIPQGVTGTEFNVDTYDDTYRLMCVYVLYLDRNLGRPLIEPGIYSGRIIDTAGVFTTGTVDVSVRIDRFTPTGELNRYESILAKGGQEALADALDDADEKGIFRFGLNVGYGVKIIALQNSGKTPYILLVSPRASARQSMGGNSRRSSAVGAATTSNNYRFTVIKLTLDAKGNGDGVYYNTAKLKFNKQHELEIEDFGSKPDTVQHVQLEQPTLPRTVPSTIVAAAGKAQIPGQSSTASVQQPTQPRMTPANVTQSAGTGMPPTTTAPVSPAPTFHAKAQLVQVDIAVTDSRGQPIRGLQQSDFTVLEDGKPQEIRAFDAHVPVANEVASPTPESVFPPPLPAHVFTNRVVSHAEDNLSILMLDLLNTPVPDQAYARKQTIEFLKTLPRGKRIAMFVLSKKLVMVQGFTDDSTTLVAAAEKVLNDRSFLLTTEADRQSFQGFTDEIARNANTVAIAGSAPAGAISSGNVADSPFGFAQQRQQSNAITEADRTSVRVNFTLDALTAVARSVSAYPGRKNLIWLSGTFPVRLKPTGIDFYRLNRTQSDETSTGLADTPDFKAAVRVMTTALATARVAVFPMDVRGLQAGGVDLTVGAAESASFSSTDNPTAYKDNLNTQSETRFQERSSIKEVAEQTGGEVLEGNDVRRAIGKALDDSSTYYTLAYTPAGDESNTQFRKIEVKLNRGGAKLAYRPGYYATATPDTPAQRAHPLIVAMQPGMPASTVIPLTVEVLPPDGTSKKTRINYTIDIRGIDFADTPEHRKRAVIDCIAVAFTQAGMPAGQISNAMDATLGPADYESAQRTGLVVKQELELPPGQYNLRMGVMDRGSQKIGTLDVPLTVTATSAAK